MIFWRDGLGLFFFFWNCETGYWATFGISCILDSGYKSAGTCVGMATGMAPPENVVAYPKMYVKLKNGLFLHRLLLMCPRMSGSRDFNR